MPDRHASLMARALELAARGRGCTSPNPMVGCVVVKDGVVVGEGFHPKAGEPHAEVFGLREAGDRAPGAAAYVTLEPCCHHGRTGPCSEALIAAGVSQVFVAQRDPNPRVNGGGIAQLEAAGIQVVTGVMEAEARRLNEAFNHWIVARTPFVTLKLATSLDGRIAAHTGSSQWITGPTSRASVHRLRAANDGVMVGSGTAFADDPKLNPRDVPHAFVPPVRIIVDSMARLPPTASVFANPGGQVVIATTDRAPTAATDALAAAGADIWRVPATDSGRVDLAALMAQLGGHNVPVTSVLVEGGGRLAGSLVRAGLVHKYEWFLAPRLIGGDGFASMGLLGVGRPADGPQLRFEQVRSVGDDIHITAYPAHSTD